MDRKNNHTGRKTQQKKKKKEKEKKSIKLKYCLPAGSFNRIISNRLLLQVPSVNTVVYEHRSFSYYAPIIWNSLPDHIKNSESVSTFKQRLKAFLFRNHYYNNI